MYGYPLLYHTTNLEPFFFIQNLAYLGPARRAHLWGRHTSAKPGYLISNDELHILQRPKVRGQVSTQLV